MVQVFTTAPWLPSRFYPRPELRGFTLPRIRADVVRGQDALVTVAGTPGLLVAQRFDRIKPRGLDGR